MTEENRQQKPTNDAFVAEPGSVGLVQRQYAQLFTAEGPMALESGESLGPIDMAYETYGTLSDARDNAILICHALSGDAHVAGRHQADDRKPGWWDEMVGPGKPFDTDKYFIICSNCLGGCMGTTGPSSVNPRTGKPYGLTFPMITIRDMVNAQVKLIERLGIEKLLAVAGGSMGGMQCLEWAIHHPDRLSAAIPIATTSRLSAQSIAFDAVGRNAILADKSFNKGNYYESGKQPAGGLAVARMVGHITYLSEEAMHAKFGRRLQSQDRYQYDFANEFSVESYLDYQGASFVDRFDANTYLYFTKAMDYFDLTQDCGSLQDAMQPVQARVLIISYSSDWLFTPRQSREMVNALLAAGKDVSYCNIECPYGHDSFLLEEVVQGRLLSGFLNQTYHMQRFGRPAQVQAAATEPVVDVTHQDPARLSGSIFQGARVDHKQIDTLIKPGTRVLDLGCGNGDLLELLRGQKEVQSYGITLNQDDVQACTERGLSVVQYDLDSGLDAFADKSFDYVVLSQTLQVIRRCEFVLREMMRVGEQVIISFPNFAYWRTRWQMLFGGRAPMWKGLPYPWYDTPSMNYMSIKDFELFVRDTLQAHLVRRLPLSSRGGHVVPFWANLIADEAIFVISDQPQRPGGDE